jgi:hypothetical protein
MIKGGIENMFMNFQIEVYEQDGKQYLYMASDGSSGVKVEVKTKEEIKQYINEYIADVVDYIM